MSKKVLLIIVILIVVGLLISLILGLVFTIKKEDSFHKVNNSTPSEPSEPNEPGSGDQTGDEVEGGENEDEEKVKEYITVTTDEGTFEFDTSKNYLKLRTGIYSGYVKENRNDLLSEMKDNAFSITSSSSDQTISFNYNYVLGWENIGEVDGDLEEDYFAFFFVSCDPSKDTQILGAYLLVNGSDVCVKFVDNGGQYHQEVNGINNASDFRKCEVAFSFCLDGNMAVNYGIFLDGFPNCMELYLLGGRKVG